MAWPRCNWLDSSQRSRAGGCRVASNSGAGSSFTRRHHTVFLFTSVVLLHITFAVQHTDELHGLTLRCDWIGDCEVDVRAAYGLFRGLTTSNKLSFPWGFQEEIFRTDDSLLLRFRVRIFLGLNFRGSDARDRITLRVSFDFGFQGFAHNSTPLLIGGVALGFALHLFCIVTEGRRAGKACRLRHKVQRIRMGLSTV